MNATRVSCAVLFLAALTAPGCEEPAEVRPPRVSPEPSQLAAANAEIARLKEENAELVAKANGLEVKLAANEEALGQANARLKRQADALQAAGTATQTLSKLKDDNARLSTDNEKLKGQVDKLQADLGKATTANQQLTGQVQQAHKDIDALKKKGLADQQQARKTAADMARMTKMVEALRREVTQRDRQISGLEMRITGKAPAKPEPPPVWPNGTPAVQPAQPPKYVEVAARLTQVRADQGRINAGSAMGVHRGMKMAVYRGPKFVAFFLVVDAQLQSAGGFIIGRKIDPKPGDKVVSLPPTQPKPSPPAGTTKELR